MPLVAALAGSCALAACSGPSRAPTPIPPAPASSPKLDFAEFDLNGDRVDDAFADDLRRGRSPRDLIIVDVRLDEPVTRAAIDAFEAHGGEVTRIYEHVDWGWAGRIPLGQVAGLARALDGKLHFLYHGRKTERHMIEASRTGRVRGIWANGFAGSTSGYTGTSDITICVVDSGVDYSHTDLADNEVGYKDWSSSQHTSAYDDVGHGTAVAAVAVGKGTVFGVGPGTLKFGSSATQDTTGGTGTQINTIHTPAYFGGSGISVTGKLTYTGSSNNLSAAYGFASDGTESYTAQDDTTGTSVLSLPAYSGSTAAIFSPLALLPSSSGKTVSWAASMNVSNYPAVGDGFNAVQGVAPGATFYSERDTEDNWGDSGSDVYAIEGIDDCISKKAKIVNLSASGTLGMRNALDAAVQGGLVATTSAGNGGPSAGMNTVSQSAYSITVGATNDQNALTYYSNAGVQTSSPPSGTDTIKPDVVAPGGSAYRSMIIVPDTNTDEAEVNTFADVVSNDYTSMQGTSFASPFAAGAAALVIDAMQKSGTTWTWSGTTQPLFVKMLLNATATETNTNREAGYGGNPTLGRQATPKDIYEGYGIINPDAAVEAVAESLSLPLSDTVANSNLQWARRAWGRNIAVIPGSVVTLSCTVPATGDFDVYLYSATPDQYGNPVILAYSDGAGSGVNESLSYTSTAQQTVYLVVKRISGYGTWSCSGSVDSSKCGNGQLDTGEECDPTASGMSTTCCTSKCVAQSASTTCDDGNACTFADHCDGAGACSYSGHRLCAALDQCHQVGTCDPSTGVCSNPNQPDNTPCDDSSLCTSNDVCTAGVCAGTTTVFCTAQDQCHNAGTCDPNTGVCSNPKKSNGTSCDDGNLCTTGDVCSSGVCTGSAVQCTASDQCHDVGTCDPSSGLCSNPTLANGTGCDDGNLCTTGDSCQNGTCTGTAKQCTALDQCHSAGTCTPSTGVCSNPKKANGTTCDDSNACTSGETCQSGVCQGGTQKTCTASDQCHQAGTCNPSTGACSNPTQPDGTSCNDSNKCTTNDVCTSGSCAGTAVVCKALDQCHTVGVCQSSTGTCTNPVATNGTTCNDSNPCTTNDQCKSGACSGTAVVCTPVDQCHLAGSCSVGTGQCSTGAAKADGTLCNDNSACTTGDVCTGGSCAGTPVVCTALDQCHVAGSCDGSTGKCTNPTATDGTTCNDNNKCTGGDVCTSGVCAGVATSCPASGPCTTGMCVAATGACTTVNVADGTPCGTGCGASCMAGVCTAAPAYCSPVDQCHVAGMCDPNTGLCSNPNKQDGSSCDDGNACTRNDSCANGSCAGTPIVCTALDECHVAGSCDALSGTCSNPFAPDGTSCAGGAGTCMSGACLGPDGGVVNVHDMAMLPDLALRPRDMAQASGDLALAGTRDLAMAAPQDLGVAADLGATADDLGAVAAGDLGGKPPAMKTGAPAGCACDVGGRGSLPPMGLLLIGFALLARRRRRG